MEGLHGAEEGTIGIESADVYYFVGGGDFWIGGVELTILLERLWVDSIFWGWYEVLAPFGPEVGFHLLWVCEDGTLSCPGIRDLDPPGSCFAEDWEDAVPELFGVELFIFVHLFKSFFPVFAVDSVTFGFQEFGYAGFVSV